MVVACLLALPAVFFYLLLRGAGMQRDWEQENREQAEYLREYRRKRRK